MEINKELVSLKAYLPNDAILVKIIQLCQLYPVESWKNWTDHLGNILNVKSKKTISLQSSPAEEKIITDIYHKAPPKNIIKNSKWALIIFNQDQIRLWLLGKDNRLRLIEYQKETWIENQPPLTYGLSTLRMVVMHLGIEVSFSSTSFPKVWSTTLPLTEEIKTDLLSSNKFLASKILENL